MKEHFIRLPLTVKRDVLVVEKECTLVKMFVKAGTYPPIHTHPQDQIDYMINGAADVIIEGVVTHVKQGEAIHIPGGAEHAFLTSDEDQEFLEFFTPGREDAEMMHQD